MCCAALLYFCFVLFFCLWCWRWFVQTIVLYVVSYDGCKTGPDLKERLSIYRNGEHHPPSIRQSTFGTLFIASTVQLLVAFENLQGTFVCVFGCCAQSPRGHDMVYQPVVILVFGFVLRGMLTSDWLTGPLIGFL